MSRNEDQTRRELIDPNLREGQPLLALFLFMPMLSWYPGGWRSGTRP